METDWVCVVLRRVCASVSVRPEIDAAVRYTYSSETEAKCFGKKEMNLRMSSGSNKYTGEHNGDATAMILNTLFIEVLLIFSS